jgi:L-lactate dehydrogenase complex protein LldF
MSRPAPTGVHAWPKRSFPDAAKELLQDAQMRMNVLHATTVITNKRNRVVQELSDWERLRDSGSDIRRHVLNHLDIYLLQFEDACTRAGGRVHWARDSEEANRIVLKILKGHEASAAIKIKSMTTEEIGLNAALEHAGIRTHETDLAELIVQLGKDKPSHIVVPALHKNRQQIRDIFLREMKLEKLGDSAEDLISAARYYLRRRFLETPFAISGANFLVAETGSVAIVESEGNGRMCLTLPKVLISIAGIEKVIPCFQDLEVFFQTLPRSATGERMNPYNSVWTGVHMSDGPQEFHVILLDNARSEILRDIETRETLKCIRCGACQNVCPVYRQTGGHAYGSVYAGPIGAILTPQLNLLKEAESLPYASSLCGACFEVCPVKIDIPEVLIHLRGQITRKEQESVTGRLSPWNLGMQVAAAVFASGDRLKLAQLLGRLGQQPFVSSRGFIEHLPFMLGGWTQSRDLAPLPEETFRSWWSKRAARTSEKDGELR